MSGEKDTRTDQELYSASSAPDRASLGGAISYNARELNEGRVTYQGGAAAKAREDERRGMLLALPRERYLDEQHLHDLVEHVATWAPDTMRQQDLRRVGAAQLRGRILSQSEYEDLRTRWHEHGR